MRRIEIHCVREEGGAREAGAPQCPGQFLLRACTSVVAGGALGGSMYWEYKMGMCVGGRAKQVAHSVPRSLCCVHVLVWWRVGAGSGSMYRES